MGLTVVALQAGAAQGAAAQAGASVAGPAQAAAQRATPKGAAAATRAAATAGAQVSRFVPLAPTPVLDTRSHLERRGSRRIPAHVGIDFPVAGRAGVPASGVTAVVLDVSAVTPSRAGYLTAYNDNPSPSLPAAQTVRFTAGRSATGLVMVPVGFNGKVGIYNGSPGWTYLTADVLGYYTTTSTAGTGFYRGCAGIRPVCPPGPVRILSRHRVRARHVFTLKVAGNNHIPAQGVEATAIDVTVSGAGKAGVLIAYAHGAPRPEVRSLSFAARQKVTTLIIARVTDGKVNLYNASGGSLRLTADAVGYYSSAGAAFQPVNARRVMDTRTGYGGAGKAIRPHATAALNPLWNTVLPSGAGVTDVVLNVTVLGDRSAGALTVYPKSAWRPGTPNIAFARNQFQSNLVIVPTGSLVDFYNGSGADLQVVAQLEGYYTN
jgi:hypothetical protein